MVFETRQTHLASTAGLSPESIELQLQLKMELQQVEQYLKETYPEETELHEMNPELLLEAYGSEMLHTISQNKLNAEKERKDQKNDER